MSLLKPLKSHRQLHWCSIWTWPLRFAPRGLWSSMGPLDRRHLDFRCFSVSWQTRLICWLKWLECNSIYDDHCLHINIYMHVYIYIRMYSYIYIYTYLCVCVSVFMSHHWEDPHIQLKSLSRCEWIAGSGVVLTFQCLVSGLRLWPHSYRSLVFLEALCSAVERLGTVRCRELTHHANQMQMQLATEISYFLFSLDHLR